MSNRLSTGSRHRLQSWTAPAARADVTVRDDPRDITAMLNRERANAKRRQGEMVGHPANDTPLSPWSAVFAAVFLAFCIGLVFLTAWQVATIYELSK